MSAINQITRDDVEAAREGILAGAFTPSDYQTIAQRSAIYPGQGTYIGLMYVALKLNGEAGEFAEHVGKALRDDGVLAAEFETRAEGYRVGRISIAPLSKERHAALVKELGDVLWYAAAGLRELGLTLEEGMLENLEKLCSRTERDALRGSGDER